MFSNSKEEHPTIRVIFTPDEEVGKGVAKLDLEQVKLDFAYTVDGGFLLDLVIIFR